MGIILNMPIQFFVDHDEETDITLIRCKSFELSTAKRNNQKRLYSEFFDFLYNFASIISMPKRLYSEFFDFLYNFASIISMPDKSPSIGSDFLKYFPYPCQLHCSS